MKKWASRLLKISFFLFALLAVILTVMVNMGGNSDTLKSAIEDYLAGATGYSANIRTLNNMTFFPAISMDVKGIEMRDRSDDGELHEILINADSAKLSFGFWDLMTANRKIRALDIRGAVFTAGTILDNRVIIKDLAIDEDADGQAFLGLNATIGDDKITARVNMKGRGKPAKRRYSIGDESMLNAEIGAFKINGILRPRALGGFHFRDFTVIHDGKELISGTVSFVRNANDNIKLKGGVALGTSPTQGTLELSTASQETRSIITGEINAQTFHARDFKAGAPLATALADWQRIFANKNRANNQTDIDITLTADIFENEQGVQTPDYKGMITNNNKTLIFTPRTENKK